MHLFDGLNNSKSWPRFNLSHKLTHFLLGTQSWVNDEQKVNPLTQQKWNNTITLLRNLTERVPSMICLSEVDNMYFVYYICPLLCYAMCNKKECDCDVLGIPNDAYNNTQSKSDKPFITKSWALRADGLITQNNEKATLNIIMWQKEWKAEGQHTEYWEFDIHTIYSEWHVSWVLSRLIYSLAGECLIITSLRKRKSFLIHWSRVCSILLSLQRLCSPSFQGRFWNGYITGNRAMEHLNYGHWNESHLALVFFLG